MAPEILNMRPFDDTVDMWSLGVTIYESLFGFPPFPANNHEELLQKIIDGVIKIPLGVDVSNSCLDFISKCLNNDP